MKNITPRTKSIIIGITAVSIFSVGLYARPALDLGIELAGAMFSSRDTQTYIAPPSEYETAVNALWKSERHQAVCKANAAATVSVTLARKYLEEAEKQAVLSTYDLPASEAMEKVSGKSDKKEYGKR